MSKFKKPLQEIEFLNNPNLSFKQLSDAYPTLWKQLQAVLKNEKEQEQKAFLNKTMQLFKHHQTKVQNSGGDPRVIKLSLPFLVRARLLMLAMEDMSKGMTKNNKLRFGILGGRVFNKLLFKKGRAKAASWFWTRFWWRFLPSRKMLMPAVQGKGISAFYSKALVSKVKDLIAGRSCIEIAAGHGDLSRYLQDRGVAIQATDDYSWEKYIEYPAEVEKLDAQSALRKYPSKVVLCAFPPPNNSFEAKVFEDPEVELYIVLGSREEGMCFNMRAYQSQKNFTMSEDPALASWMLPPSSNWVAYLFKRK